ncbi:carboxymuconolactone decarboxylase family protein [Halorhabdus amylolytica]|uniref:carboxymuconolactone decarboxylase family protein n=1 Tax=Halorhabdus amylolytica TaxID=2559573 RepID=UPI0010AA2961|nr:carboxymuconolactone decarboxylase family protein [Halorhabdus amylolytica]
MVDEIDGPEELPDAPAQLAEEFPEVWDAYSELGKACSEAGGIDGETKRLVKLAMAIGAQSEGAVHSHVRRGLEEDVDPETLRQVAILAIPTIGFPKAMAALTWIDDLAE